MPGVPLQATGRARRRKLANRVAEVVATGAALLAVAVLALVVGSVFLRGVGALNLDFLTKTPATFGESGGGIANAIVGSALLIVMAAAMAIPVAILVAIYVSEFAPPTINADDQPRARRAERRARRS